MNKIKEDIPNITTYNINDMATVTLTVEGVNVLKQYYVAFSVCKKSPISGFNQKTRLYKTELWNIMGIFGKELYMGGKQMFVKNNISIQKEQRP
jgi:hypothetical protein